jgi:hypothetical protein
MRFDRRVFFKFAAVVLGVSIALLAVFCVDRMLASFPPRQYRQGFGASPQKTNQDFLGEAATTHGLFPPMPELRDGKKHHYRKSAEFDGTENREHIGQLFGAWRDLPFWVPTETARIVGTRAGKTLYDVTYTIDPSWARRVTPGEDAKKASRFLILSGCSFTFGEGLPDDETLPAWIGRETPETRVYNYGFPGASTGEDWLRLVSIEPDDGEITEKSGTVIYVFMDRHPARTFGKMSIIGTWGPHKTHFFLDENGDVQNDGMFMYAEPFRTEAFQFFSQSGILSYFGIDLPLWDSENDWQLFAKIIKNMDSEAHRLGAQKFYVLFWPASQLSTKVIPYLEREGISYLDYSHWQLDRVTHGHHVIPGDGHPSSESDQALAKSIVETIKP